MLAARAARIDSSWVFSGKKGRPLRVTSLDPMHWKARTTIRLPKDCVLPSLCHTMLTGLGETGADVFTIVRISGQSNVTVSQRYGHPTPEAMERAFQRLEALNEKASGRLPEAQKRRLPVTVPATLPEVPSVSPCGPVAQWLEQRTHNPSVVGSSPTGPTIPQRLRTGEARTGPAPLSGREIIVFRGPCR